LKKLILLLLTLNLVSIQGRPLTAREINTANQGSKLKSMSGVRIGGTYILPNRGPNGKELQEVLDNAGMSSNFITQFGYQFEKRFGNQEGQATGVLALVLLGGGFNQGIVIPSLTGVVGFRLGNGFEFGGGPNVVMSKTGSGNLTIEPGFAWTVGYSPKVGRLRLPVSLATVQSESGLRLSTLVGIVW
jgi:hypothetical protein